MRSAGRRKRHKGKHFFDFSYLAPVSYDYEEYAAQNRRIPGRRARFRRGFRSDAADHAFPAAGRLLLFEKRSPDEPLDASEPGFRPLPARLQERSGNPAVGQDNRVVGDVEFHAVRRHRT